MKKCPFKLEQCNSDCALFVSKEELNELVVNRLKAIGVYSDKLGGLCSLKSMGLAQLRYMFENTTVYNNKN
ncbi:TPA: hypothetical protein IAA86_02370 [Candidatus Galligastranaerophilus intestinavium]|uniref:Uncharacterized protein n=1 Tax=Candidatus Galligastranaerophilus intestinavium TaxID=2840836 RepID=A0A9D1FHW2_9BACT|nr:hypothetical protein [Candidatus Galligastranaerophilus intestinavium]